MLKEADDHSAFSFHYAFLLSCPKEVFQPYQIKLIPNIRSICFKNGKAQEKPVQQSNLNCMSDKSYNTAGGLGHILIFFSVNIDSECDSVSKTSATEKNTTENRSLQKAGRKEKNKHKPSGEDEGCDTLSLLLVSSILNLPPSLLQQTC